MKILNSQLYTFFQYFGHIGQNIQILSEKYQLFHPGVRNIEKKYIVANSKF